jgi:hypothetical protein
MTEFQTFRIARQRVGKGGASVRRAGLMILESGPGTGRA